MSARMMLALLSSLSAAPVSAAAPTGTVVVTLAGAQGDGAAADQPFADAVGQALGEANFTVMPGADHSRYIAQVSVMREPRGQVAVKAPRGKSGASLVGGPALVVPLGSGGTRMRDLTTTRLTIRLIARDERRPVWSATAVTVAIDAAATPIKLARAAVATYPQILSQPVSVP